jgi:cell division septation protein DedD
MRPSVRQRIIGLGLLVLLLLILVPWATQVPDKLQLHLDARLPTPPAVDWQPLASPIEADSLEQVRADIARQRQDAVAASPDELAAADQGKLRAFALELGRYDNRAGAEAERQRLNDAGYRAYVRQEKVRQQDAAFVLYAGPELDLSRLHLLQLHLNEDKRFHFDAEKVVTYRP